MDYVFYDSYDDIFFMGNIADRYYVEGFTAALARSGLVSSVSYVGEL